MMRIRILAPLVLALVASPGVLMAQQVAQSEFDIQPLSPNGDVTFYFTNGASVATAAGGVIIRYAGAVLTADRTVLNQGTDTVEAEGNVRIQQGDQTWASDHLVYNFKTRQIEASQFRTGQAPFFAEGRDLHADVTNRIYVATNAVVTADDIANPVLKMKAKRIKIIPGKKIQAYNAVLYAGDVPVFYFPYYSRNIGEHPNNFNFTPGQRSSYGPFILGNYTWWYNEELNGVFHFDYREKRGPGTGPDFNYNLGKWGEGSIRYYYTHDREPETDQLGVPISEDRQRVWFSYQANPATNLYVIGMARYESDLAVSRDFFQGEYRQDPQPSTFMEVNKFWQNFSLDTYVQPRLNNFLETVERLPDIRLTGYRQEIGASPLYYESQSSFGYYRFKYAVNSGLYGAPPGLDYEATRGDTYHQVLLPETFFGWLNVTPRVGGRLTYYGEASGPGATTDEQTRGVFNTGAEASFKASRVWPGIQSDFFDVDGLRHIIQPSANYVFIPNPTTATNNLPQFDYELPSLRLLPLDFPAYNSIDSIQSQNAIRWDLHNKLQTKREGQVVNLVDWDVYADWHLHPRSDQTTFSDLYSDLTLKPKSWLTFESLTRFDISEDDWNMSFTSLTIQPNSTWSFRLGHYYVRNTGNTTTNLTGIGNNVLSGGISYRLNENWGFRTTQYYDVDAGELREQTYSVFRDLRSWTAAVSFLVRHNTTGPSDYGFAFTFSLKAFPRFGTSPDTSGQSSLLGGG